MLLLCLLCACLCTQALAVSPQSCAEELSAIDVFRGTDTGFELDRAPKRSEAAVMLVRLYGAEEEALSLYEAGLIAHPFEDVSGWAAPYLAWLYSEGLVRGVSETRYGADAPCRARDYALFCCARWAIRTARTLPGRDRRLRRSLRLLQPRAVRRHVHARRSGAYDVAGAAVPVRGRQRHAARRSYCARRHRTDAARTLEASFRKSPVHVRRRDGHAGRRGLAQRACAELEITVQFESGTETLSGEALRALVAADGTVRTDELDALVSGWAGQYGTYNTPLPL